MSKHNFHFNRLAPSPVNFAKPQAAKAAASSCLTWMNLTARSISRSKCRAHIPSACHRGPIKPSKWGSLGKSPPPRRVTKSSQRTVRKAVADSRRSLSSCPSCSAGSPCSAISLAGHRGSNPAHERGRALATPAPYHGARLPQQTHRRVRCLNSFTD